ncbi:MAG: hypothetical protein ACSHW2_10510 [Parasphingopyxis sp.]
MSSARYAIAALIGTGILASGCAHQGYGQGGYSRGADYHGSYGRDYRDGNGYRGNHGYADRYASNFTGPGADKLDPWLAETREGQQFVRDNYDIGRSGEISNGVAASVNQFFRRWADTNRDYQLTDAEIRTALVHTRNRYRYRGY